MDSDVSFKNLLDDICKKFTPEVKNNLSTQTCFVCLLHLANEKSKKYIIEIFSYYVFQILN
jgi:hypothetical protein